MFARFSRELKRRRVLNTATLYVVAAWVVLQVAEVLKDMLPADTMRGLLIGLAALYPLVIVAGWYLDISAAGIRRTPPLQPDEPAAKPQFIDHVQLIGHLLIVAFVSYLIVLPPPEPTAAASAPEQKRTLAVLAFEDLAPVSEEDRIGAALAEELRQGLTRTAGLRIMGPATSDMLLAAGEAQSKMAAELEISALLQGTVHNEHGQLVVDARIIAIPGGTPIWQASFAGPVGDAIRLQQDLMRSVIGAVAPSLDPDPVNGPRAEAGQCASVYDRVLRGRQLSATSFTDPDKDTKRQRGRELIQQATEVDPDCALAWEALALIDWNYSLGGYARAGASARRALELNATLAEAWGILGEIAEQEGRWSDAEEYFLKGIHSDPTNLRVNLQYSESLITRGRVKEALRHALDVYRREPADWGVNWRVQFAATYAGEWDLVLRHVGLYEELRPQGRWLVWWNKAYALLMRGEREEAMQIFTEYLTGDVPDYAKWYLTCVKARDDESLRPGLHEAMAATIEEHGGKNTEADMWAFPINWAWPVISCDAWIGDGDLAVRILQGSGLEAITEAQWFAFFMSEWKVLRQHPRFREAVVDRGLLDYWRQWGWADYCEPVGDDDFRCD
jgi:TolB-like protein/Flp pilus assembly protein TadD